MQGCSDAPEVVVGQQLVECKSLFIQRSFRKEKLYERGVTQGNATRLRTVFWRLCTGALTVPPDGCPAAEAAALWRGDVARAEVLLAAPQEQSVDEDLAATIEADVKRLPSAGAVCGRVQELLTRFAAQRPEVGYVQGMHDLMCCCLTQCLRDAAPLRELSADARAAKEDTHAHELAVLDVCFSMTEPAAAAYSLFDALVAGPRLGLAAWLGDSDDGGDESVPVLRAAECVQDGLLRARDPGLALILSRNAVPPALYCVRWLRTLFLRELPDDGALILWDAILTDALWRHLESPRPPPANGTTASPRDPPVARGLALHVVCELLVLGLGPDLRAAGGPCGVLKRLAQLPAAAPSVDPLSVVAGAVDSSGSALGCYVHRCAPELLQLQQQQPRRRETSSPPVSPLADKSHTRNLGKLLADVLARAESLWRDDGTGERQRERRVTLLSDLKRIRDALLSKASPRSSPRASPRPPLPRSSPPPLTQGF
eukprot:TRINITY_DN816_c0_g1_i1.p1 TRINITY_DN816_c0_g1~~TRINITY_DN816_c0_g1_i1.p1  ORF type:complete len:485 (+),score=142.02 TRINITY_DN816_c0_g1_i1:58-1512(+)